MEVCAKFPCMMLIACGQKELWSSPRSSRVRLSGEKALYKEVGQMIRIHCVTQSDLAVKVMLDLSLRELTRRSLDISSSSCNTADFAASVHARATSA
jgi:hypothetical protein